MEIIKIYSRNGKLSFVGDTLATFHEYETALHDTNPHSMLDIFNCLDPYEMVEVNYNGVPTVFEIDENLNLINHEPTIKQLEQEERADKVRAIYALSLEQRQKDYKPLSTKWHQVVDETNDVFAGLTKTQRAIVIELRQENKDWVLYYKIAR